MPTVLQFRRGTTSQNNAFTGAIGEITYDTTVDVLRIHDGSTAGGFAMSTASATETLTNKTLTSPVVNTGTFGTSILPVSADGTTLGSASKEFSDLFLADASTIQFGNDQDVTLTHVADTGLQLNSTMKLMFNDASQFIHAPSATVLDIAATDEIELTATEVEVNVTTLDINGNVEISGTATTTGVHTFTAVPVFPNNTIETADIQADAITGAKIADNAIDSEHYTDGSIDTAHIAADQIVGSLIADNAINSEHYTDGSIDTAHIADDQITEAKMANDAIGSAELKTLSTLLIKNSSGSTLKTVHGAGA